MQKNETDKIKEDLHPGAFQKFAIITTTMVDRAMAKIAKTTKPPFKGRKTVSNPLEAVENITNATNDLIEKYLRDLSSKHLLESIDRRLQENLPLRRYDQIKSFSNNEQWIKILEAVYVLVRISKPSVVVETGVGELGMSSTYILSALQDNGQGTLYSIDPDKFFPIYGYHIGAAIPDDLKDRHQIIVGTSQLELEKLLEKVDKIDIFLHDGDHRYNTKLMEYELVYKYSNGRCFILSDDTWDSAFDVFQDRYKIKGYSVRLGKDNFFSFCTRK